MNSLSAASVYLPVFATVRNAPSFLKSILQASFLNVFRYSYFSYKENCTIYGIEKVQRGRIVFYEWVVVGPMTLPKWNNSNPHAWVIPLGKVVLPQGNRANGCEM